LFGLDCYLKRKGDKFDCFSTSKMASKKLTDQQMKEMKAAFALFDKDGDGRITAKELGDAMRKLGQKPTDKEILAMIKEVDTDQNGTVEFEEFVVMMAQKLGGASSDEDMKAAFKTFDLDGDGKITAKELKQAMKQMGNNLTDAEVQEMIKAADLDKNGTIEYNEFVEMMKDQ